MALCRENDLIFQTFIGNSGILSTTKIYCQIQILDKKYQIFLEDSIHWNELLVFRCDIKPNWESCMELSLIFFFKKWLVEKYLQMDNGISFLSGIPLTFVNSTHYWHRKCTGRKKLDLRSPGYLKLNVWIRYWKIKNINTCRVCVFTHKLVEYIFSIITMTTYNTCCVNHYLL